MKRALFAATVLLGCAGALEAQSAENPNLVFNIYGGLTASGSLWELPQQRLLAPGSAPPPEDTVSLGRALRPGIVAGLNIAYYRSPHFGIAFDVAYFGLGSDQRCTGPANYKPDVENLNQQRCEGANGEHVGTEVVGFMLGGVYRILPNGPIEPYLRAGAGLGLLGNSFVLTSATVHHSGCQNSNNICASTVLDEEKTQNFTWVASFSFGSSFRLSPSSRLLFELRDIITSLPVVTGPKDPLDNNSFAATSRKVKHVPAFLVGVAITLERGHGRRY